VRRGKKERYRRPEIHESWDDSSGGHTGPGGGWGVREPECMNQGIVPGGCGWSSVLIRLPVHTRYLQVLYHIHRASEPPASLLSAAKLVGRHTYNTVRSTRRRRGGSPTGAGDGGGKLSSRQRTGHSRTRNEQWVLGGARSLDVALQILGTLGGSTCT
jgi:hypothetical protein